METEEFKKAFNKFLEVTNETVQKETDGLQYLTFKKGLKYIKIIQKDEANRDKPVTYGSAWAFIDSEGNILKPDGWSRPAKHARGNIFTTDPATISWTGPHYLK